MPSIFISYSRESKDLAASVAADINELGHAVWFDHRLTGGQAWWDEILATIRQCDAFVFVLTPHALSSAACTLEYGYAAALGKPILPVLVSDGVSTNLLPPALAQIHFVDYRSADRAAGLRLSRALSSLPAAPPLPDPLPAAPAVPTSYLGSVNERIEGNATLSYEQQSALLLDLKRGLRDAEMAEDSRALLKRLRRRRDLFAAIAEEIDEMLGSARKPETPPATPPTQATPPRDPSPAKRVESPAPKVEQKAPVPPRPQSPQASRVPPAVPVRPQSSAQAQTASPPSQAKPLGAKLGPPTKERLAAMGWGILIGAVYGYVVALILKESNEAHLYGLIFTGPAGAIVGLISGYRRRRIAAAAIGAAAGCIIVSLAWQIVGYKLIAGAIIGASGGAVLGAVISLFLRDAAPEGRSVTKPAAP